MQGSSKWDSNRLAVIDLGSNTFHLIIVELDQENQSFKLLKRQRDFVYLSKDGIEHLSSETINRALYSLSELKTLCQKFETKRIKIIGTAALRSAGNANEFLSQAKSKLDLDIEVIDGNREAELIHKGSLFLKDNSSKENNESTQLIMDIGGGSVEFIVSHNREMKYFVSKNVGISILKKRFRMEGVISESKRGEEGVASDQTGNSFEVKEVIDLCPQIIETTPEQRTAFSFMPENRADLALESFMLLEYILKRLPSLRKIRVTSYALKEGVIYEAMT